MHASNASPALPGFLKSAPDGVTLTLKVTPRASRDEIGAPLGDELRVKVTAPPVDAAANEALIRLLAERLDCPRSAVQILRGQTSRHKVVKVFGIAARSVLNRLSENTQLHNPSK